MAKLIVYYPRHEGCRFDRDYYLATHVPIVGDAWTEAGMTGAEIEWPFDDTQPFACLIGIAFADQGAIDAALGSAATAGVLADVANFTDITPSLYRTT
ncbi:EthD family reductase [Croceicoccus ponticola]|uniref:EthD family reductase n=1 Tax=Croceicoccus ponticola TaxID=2217664 RepID=A0A437GVW6_9SPHN|nr:EthD family reductase [Croceicoccus ponticola]RVQ66014.1 EthD family reductase [Croceicoccus ponticola]